MIGPARFPARTAAFAGLTFALYGCYEAETAVRGEGERGRVLARWTARYGRALLSLYGVRLRTSGTPYPDDVLPGHDARGRGRMFVMNHRSGLDIPVLLATVDAKLVSRADLASWPVIGFAARRAGTLFVDRGSASSGARVVQTMTNTLAAGTGVVVFPEGTTYPGDEVRAFKPGAFVAAQRADAEIVPLGVAYASGGAAFGDETFLQHMQRVAAAPETRVALVVGEPLPGGADVEATKRAAHREVERLVLAARALVDG